MQDREARSSQLTKVALRLKAFEEEERTDPATKKLVSDIRSIIAEVPPLCLRTVRALLNERFAIPSYQRLYRWRPEQVTQLLDDIEGFNPSQEERFYCLQPIVVRRDSEDRWEVIDGQQRLTTIRLILGYLSRGSVNITYGSDSRGNTMPQFFAKLVEATAHESQSIDEENLTNAYEAIKTWFENRTDSRQIWAEKLLDSTKVVWYQHKISEQEGGTDSAGERDAITVFERLNVGKIPLTNGELIRALFVLNIDRCHQGGFSSLEPTSFASEWDRIESDLHAPDFWSFLCLKGNRTLPTRIDLLFELSASTVATESSPLAIFTHYEEKFRRHKENLVELSRELFQSWAHIRNCYHRLMSWYEDDRLYHLVGFCLCRAGKTLAYLLKAADHETHAGFIGKLREWAFTTLKIQPLPEGSSTLTKELEQLTYKANAPSHAALLIMNLHAHEGETTRFPFSRYSQTPWSLEHIHAQRSEELSPRDEIEVLLDDLTCPRPDGLTAEEIEFLEHCLKTARGKEDDVAARQQIVAIHARVFDGDEFDLNAVDSLANLALLPKAVNSSLGNRRFATKRLKLMRPAILDSFFIPLATKRVFSKAYSESVGHILKWTPSDRQDYINQLARSIGEFCLMKGATV